ncbi:DNA mismatch repair protein MutS [Candidatus Hepatincolaceae symbiont of Richtersius coronifer]
MSSKSSPMMHQYLEIKKNHTDYLLFFRMGDFYEMFFEDAVIASNSLGIILTKRGSLNDENIPMCGVPVHSYETYLNRLIKAGYKVALCEQVEDATEAKKRGYKSVVKRDVVRIITPGTLTEDSLLEQNSYNFLCCLYVLGKGAFISWIDISTGDIYLQTANFTEINTILYKIAPKEILVSKGLDLKMLGEEFKNLCTLVPKERFNKESAVSLLRKVFQDKEFIFETLSLGEQISCGVLLDFVLLTQKSIPSITFPQRNDNKDFVRMDLFTRKSLELTKSANNDNTGSLKASINKTLTACGSRMLNNWLNNPLTNKEQIYNRLESVRFFVKNPELLKSFRECLKNIPEIERACGRICLKRGSALDLNLIKMALRLLIKVKSIFFNHEMPFYLLNMIEALGSYNALLSELELGLEENITGSPKEGGIIKVGYKKELDFLLQRKKSLLVELVELQNQYIIDFKINNLKILYNNLVGYFIEVPIKHSNIGNQYNYLIHKQTLGNSIRYTTKDLITLEGELAKIRLQSSSLELEILKDFFEHVIKEKDNLNLTCKSLAALDILAGFATLALEHSLIEPIIDSSLKLNIVQGRHIVVERSLKNQGEETFIPNDCEMPPEKNIFLITGPNMSGKSTFLRQNALIIIMAQIGCFVPANKAEIGIVDSIYSRVGASDDLFKGQSTFMVEMLELAIILNNATERSFIILDEIGRGTSTYDGLSIAWATLEYLNNSVQAKTLFATHYHELVEIKNSLDKISYYYVKVEEHNNKIIFMHSILKGSIDKSYGIEVAKLAGLPYKVIERAKEILNSLKYSKNLLVANVADYRELEEETDLIAYRNSSNNKSKLNSGFIADLFPLNLNKQNPKDEVINKILENIKDLDLDDLTPKAAMNIIYDIKEKLTKN